MSAFSFLPDEAPDRLIVLQICSTEWEVSEVLQSLLSSSHEPRSVPASPSRVSRPISIAGGNAHPFPCVH
jgi:hypothetical protein